MVFIFGLFVGPGGQGGAKGLRAPLAFGGGFGAFWRASSEHWSSLRWLVVGGGPGPGRSGGQMH